MPATATGWEFLRALVERLLDWPFLGFFLVILLYRRLGRETVQQIGLTLASRMRFPLLKTERESEGIDGETPRP